MASLLLMCERESDLSRLLAGCFSAFRRVRINEKTDFDACDAIAVLGGTEKRPLSLLPPVRAALEKQRAKGKRVLCEFTCGAGEACFANAVPTDRDRPVCVKAGMGCAPGDVLNEQGNTRLPIQYMPPNACTLLQYVTRPDGYLRADVPEKRDACAALFEEPEGLMQCAFRMADFARARFTPRKSWKMLLRALVLWLGGRFDDELAEKIMADMYVFSGAQPLAVCAARAADWFERAGMLVDYGGAPCAVLEGVSSIIAPDGAQEKARQLRLDAAGETALMYELKYRVFHQPRDHEWAESLFDTVRQMRLTQGLHAGMVRGSLGWWGNASYQDDASRGFVLPLAARALLSGDARDLPAIRSALDYLLLSTGTDGLRVNQVNRLSMDGEAVLAARLQFNGVKWKNTGFYETTLSALRASPADNPSAHYNAWYMAALILGSRLLGDKKYLAAGLRGLNTLMARYPNTAREHSQTQELCRLILPLALLYGETHEAAHRAWLDRVTGDLCAFRARPGAFVEHDEGYTASCSHAARGECSVFCENGDPVCDFLYSMNWLPVSFAAAWKTTGDEKFKNLFRETASFIASVQLKSPDPLLDGAWARAADVRALEVNGVDNDRDWSIWTIESGWTVAEIASGMLLGLLLGAEKSVD